MQYLARRYRVHVAGFARDARALTRIDAVRPLCASLYIEPLRKIDLPRKALQFLFGKSLTASYYESGSLREYVRRLSGEVRLAATVAFTSVMVSYAPPGTPLLVDMVDVDSEKWVEYARRRKPSWFYQTEADRLRAHERAIARSAKSLVLTTDQESALLRRIVPGCRVRSVENGVDLQYFDPETTPAAPELANRKYIVMVGAMNYFPNSDGAVWFAREVFPQIRASAPELEFLIVGHSPLSSVQRLASLPGVTVTGYVPDVRPYIAQSITAVTPLRIARGVQNKVLEALGMGKTVLASAEIARTFGAIRPAGLCVCGTPEEYTREVLRRLSGPPGFEPAIREATQSRFSWEQKLEGLDEELRFTIGSEPRVSP